MKRRETLIFSGRFADVKEFMRRYKLALATGEAVEFDVVAGIPSHLTYPNSAHAAAAALAEACRMAEAHARLQKADITVRLRAPDSHAELNL